jgi:isoleucyl-tRNA synthetase
MVLCRLWTYKSSSCNSEFVQENLSNWYVRLCRRRFWKGNMRRTKSPYQTLYTCLLTISKLGAPIAPFFMDKLYRDLTVTTDWKIWQCTFGGVSISVENYVNKMLESKMQKAQTISSLVLSPKKEMIRYANRCKGNDSSTWRQSKSEIEAVSDLIKQR